MSIPLDQCSGVDYLDLLSCGICGGLAISPLSHNGGNSQPFCQRLFCSVCIASVVKNPIYVNQSQFSGKIIRKNKKDPKSVPVSKPYGFIDCPIENCSIDFRQPYFTEPGLIDMVIYSKVIVECKNCTGHFDVYSFLAHRSRCQVGVPMVHSANRVNNISSVATNLANYSAVKQVSYNSQFRGVSVNGIGSGSFIINNNINIRLRAQGRGNADLDFPLDATVSDVFQKIASAGNFDPDAIDLISFRHVVLSQFSTLRGFIDFISRSADITLIDKRAHYGDPRMDLCISVLGTYPRDKKRYPEVINEE